MTEPKTIDKKRAALVFSGQLRNIDSGYWHIKTNIFDINKDDWDIDVFMHTWLELDNFGKVYMAANGSVASSPLDTDTLYSLYKYYNPKKLLIEKQIKFDEKQFGDRKARLIIPWYSISKCYSIQKSIELKQKAEFEENFTYDLVMTIRTDLGINNKVNFNDFDLGCASMSTHGVSEGIGVDVTHCIMNSKNADTYAIILDHVEKYFNEGTLFCDEHFFHKHLETMHIPINRTTLLNDYTLLRG